MKKLLIIGAGDLGQQIAHFVTTDNQFEVVGYVDDWQEKGTIINGKPVLGCIDDLLKLYANGQFEEVLIGIGYKHFEFRKRLYEKYKDSISFATFVHSSCYVDPTVEIGKGVVVYPRCIIDKNARVFDNVIIDFGAGIGHDSSIGQHSFIAPMTALGGSVGVGEMCFIGIGSTIIDHIQITNSITVGGGAVVVKNIVEPNGIYVGNPARFLKKRD